MGLPNLTTSAHKGKTEEYSKRVREMIEEDNNFNDDMDGMIV